MSELLVTSIYNQEGEGAPNFPKGATVTGVITATSFSGSGANLTGIDATALKDDGGSVKIQANSDGAVVAGILTVNSNVSIAGTLTYEDVTNIDSVGLITARSGVKVNAGGVDIAGGGINAVGVVTATSFAGSGANLTDIDALPSVTGTASGSITADKAVMIKADGTYEAVTGVAESQGTRNQMTGGGNTEIYNANGQLFSTYDPDSSKGIIAYKDGSSQYGSRTVTVSGNTVSFGAASVIQAQTYKYVGLTYDTNKDKVIAYHKDNNDDISIDVGTISGTDISWGNHTTYSSSQARNHNNAGLAFNPLRNKIGICYNANNTNSGHGITSPCFIECELNSSNVPSNFTSTALTISSDYSALADVLFDSTAGLYLCYWRYTASPENLRAIYINSAVTNTVGAMQEITSYQIGWFPIAACHCPDAGVNVFFDTSGNATALKRTPAGVMTKSANISVVTGHMHDGISVAYDPTSKKVVFSYLKSNKLYNRSATVSSDMSGDVFGFDDERSMDPTFTTGNHNTIFNDASAGKMVNVYNAPAASGQYGNGITFTPSSTNLDSVRYLGFAASSVTDGQTVKIKTPSNTSTQTGLTTGSEYYVQKTGDIGITPVSPSVKAGLALSGTQLLIRS